MAICDTLLLAAWLAALGSGAGARPLIGSVSGIFTEVTDVGDVILDGDQVISLWGMQIADADLADTLLEGHQISCAIVGETEKGDIGDCVLFPTNPEVPSDFYSLKLFS